MTLSSLHIQEEEEEDASFQHSFISPAKKDMNEVREKSK
jgi:hypothetical protein